MGCVEWWGQMRRKYFGEQALPSNKADDKIVHGWRTELPPEKPHFSLFSKLNHFSIAESPDLWIKEVFPYQSWLIVKLPWSPALHPSPADSTHIFKRKLRP